MNDPYFGPLEYSDDLDWYSCKRNLGNNEIPIFINSENGSADFQRAKELIERLNGNIVNAKDNITDELYDIYRREWSGPIFKASKKKFQNKLEIDSIVIYTTNELDIYYNDGGLFLGHSVVLRFSEDHGFYNIHLAG